MTYEYTELVHHSTAFYMDYSGGVSISSNSCMSVTAESESLLNAFLFSNMKYDVLG